MMRVDRVEYAKHVWSQWLFGSIYGIWDKKANSAEQERAWCKTRLRSRTMLDQGPVGHDMDFNFDSKSTETIGGFSGE